MIRITGGKFKGRVIKIPKRLKVRPTRAMVREAIFDMIGPKIVNATVLDLFSGSGLLGLEAKSRGAKQIFFVEQDKTTCKTLKDNIASLTGAHDDPILCNTVYKAIKRLNHTEIKFDIVLMDPPYEMDAVPILNILSTTGIVKTKGWIVVERGKHSLEVIPEGLEEIRKKTYGYSKVYILRLFNLQEEREKTA